MKKILFAICLFPFLSTAQVATPRFENDTLYTSSGYKIYKGQTLHFGKGTGRNGKFRYVYVKSEMTESALANTSVVVKQLSKFSISSLNNGYILLEGSITFRDGSKGNVVMHMAFDRVIENSPDLPSELIVPDEFRNKYNRPVSDELSKLNKLYKEGVITKEEFEAQKKKLLE